MQYNNLIPLYELFMLFPEKSRNTVYYGNYDDISRFYFVGNSVEFIFKNGDIVNISKTSSDYMIKVQYMIPKKND